MVSKIPLHYEKCFRRTIVPIHIEKLISFVDDGMELVLYVMEYSSSKDDPYAYTLKILNNNIENKVRTLKEFKLKAQERADKLKRQQKLPKQSRFINIASHDWNFEQLEKAEMLYGELKTGMITSEEYELRIKEISIT